MINEVLKYFKNNQSELARELGIAPSAVAQWVMSGKIPPLRAIQIEKLTMGKIKAIDIIGGNKDE